MSTHSLMLWAVMPSRKPAISSGTWAKIAPGSTWNTAEVANPTTTSRRTPHRTLSGGVTAAAATNPAAVSTASSPRSASAGFTSAGAFKKLRKTRIIATVTTPYTTRWAPMASRPIPAARRCFR